MKKNGSLMIRLGVMCIMLLCVVNGLEAKNPIIHVSVTNDASDGAYTGVGVSKKTLKPITSIEEVSVTGQNAYNLFGNRNTDQTFYAWVDVAYGWKFSAWTWITASATMNVTQTHKQATISLTGISTQSGNEDYYLSTTLTRRNIEWGKPTATKGTLSWKNAEHSNAISFTNNYVLSEGDYTFVSEPVSDEMVSVSPQNFPPIIGTVDANYSGAYKTNNEGKVNVSHKYTLLTNAADKLVHNTKKTYTTTIKAQNAGTAIRSQEHTVTIDLTPNFVIMSGGEQVESSAFMMKAQTDEPHTNTFNVADFGALPIDNERLSWSVNVVYDDPTSPNVFTWTTPDAAGNFTITFTPTEDKQYVGAKFYLTAEWKDANSKEVSSIAREVVLSATCGITEGEIQLYHNGKIISSSTPIVYNIDNTNAITSDAQYEIKVIGVSSESLTFTSSKEQQGIVVTHTNGGVKFSVSGNTFNSSGEYTATFTVSGTDVLSQPNKTTTQSFTVVVKRWYSPVTLLGTSADNWANLTWNMPSVQYATQYKLYRNGAEYQSFGDGNNLCSVREYKDNDLTKETTYTYQLKINANGKWYDSNILTVATTVANIVDKNTPVSDKDNFDIVAAFDVEGNPTMDYLYLLKDDKCHVYEVDLPNKKYKWLRTDNPTITRAGKIDGTNNSAFGGNTRVYITGTCSSLSFYSEDKSNTANDRHRGWMQPVNCEVYLDDASLAAKKDASILRQFIAEKYYIAYSGISFNVGDLKGKKFSGNVPYDASVFFLPGGGELGAGQNITTFHLKGDNYLGGGMGKKLQMRLLLDVDVNINVGIAAKHQRDTYPIYYYIPNYGSPITIKQSYLFDAEGGSKPSLISCTFNSIWVDGQNTDGNLDLSTRTTSYEDQHTNTIEQTDGTYKAIALDDYVYHYINTTYTAWDGTTGPDKPNSIGNVNQQAFNQLKPTTPSDIDNDKRFVRWVNQFGKRYAPAINSGGDYGRVHIAGGNLNFWPANGIAEKMFYNYILGNANTLEILLNVSGAQYANSVVVGTQQTELKINSDYFGGDLKDVIKSQLDSDPPMINIYGAGQAYPVGTLIVEGGTITANSNPKSYAYNYFDENNQPKTALNIVDEGSDQPLVAANVQISGGTFLQENNYVFSATLDEVSFGSGNVKGTWTEGFTDPFKTRVSSLQYGVKNHCGEDVFYKPVVMDAKGQDYSHYMDYDILQIEATKDQKPVNFIVHINEANEYRYGMMNVRSDNEGKCYFYLPKHDNNFCGDKYGNFYVADGETLETFGDVKPYNLTVEKGGVLNELGSDVDGTFKVYGTPKYLIPAGEVKEDIYAPIAMPFDVATFVVNDGEEFSFDAYVERDDNASADNSNAYCYVYFLDKSGAGQNGGADISTQWTQGLDNTFRNNYHTHTDGLMKRGKTYILKFPRASGGVTTEGKPYWESYPITLVGAKGTIVNGALAYEKQLRNPRPTNDNTSNPEFYMDGNATFAEQAQLRVTNGIDAGELYEVNVAKYGDDDFHATAGTAIAPLQGYVLGATEVMKIHRVLGRGNSNGNNTTTGLGNTSAEWTVYAHGGYIYVTPVADSTMMLYTVDGQLVGTYPMVSGAQTIIPAAAGMYILRSGDAVAKVLVE